MIKESVLSYCIEMTKNIEGLNKVVGDSLTKLVKLRGIDSQEELAKRLNVHQTHVSALLRGAKLPSLELARKLAIVLDSNVDYIVGLTDDDKPFGDLDDQVVVTIDGPVRRAKVQGIADALRRMSDADLDLVASLVERIHNGRASDAPASQAEYKMLDELWMLVFMMAGANEAQSILDSGVPASPQFRRMVALAVTKNNKTRNDGT